MCWNCKVGTYITYEKSDDPILPRCGSCGELEQDDPAKKKAPAKAAPRTTKRSQ